MIEQVERGKAVTCPRKIGLARYRMAQVRVRLVADMDLVNNLIVSKTGSPSWPLRLSTSRAPLS